MNDLEKLKHRYHSLYTYYQKCINADDKRRSEEKRPFLCSFQTIALMQVLTSIQQEILYYFGNDKEKASEFLWQT